MEDHFKQVYDLALAKAAIDTFEFASEDLLLLDSISRLCYEQHGEAVVMAATLLGYERKQGISVGNNCPAAPAMATLRMTPKPPDDLKGLQTFSLYPNPTDGVVMLQIKGNHKRLALRVTTIHGQTVLTGTIPEATQLYTLGVEGLESGLYQVTVLQENGTPIGTRKLIVVN